MYLTPTSSHWVCDIEADNLLEDATQVFCVCLENAVTGEKHDFSNSDDFRSFYDRHGDRIFVVGQNFLAYDAPMLRKFWGVDIPPDRIVDTFVLSQLYDPSMKTGHSLEAWGIRLRHPKAEFSDFSKLTPEMIEYCRNDVSLTALLYRKLTARMRAIGFTEEGAEIEHSAWDIIQNQQRRNGFPFRYQKAHELYVELRSREDNLKNDIYKLWPPRLLPIKECVNPFKKDGEPSANFQRHTQQYPRVELSRDRKSYTVYDYVPFNLGSPSQRIAKLLELGWEPTQFTEKGNPKVDEDQLLAYAEISGVPELKALARWLVLNSRANMIRTWMDAYKEETKAIHGRLYIASTLRYRHSSPNSANIPAVRDRKVNGEKEILYGEAGAWTYEARDLWGFDDGADFVLVGVDATGIQNRCLIHHLIKTVGEDAVREFKEISLEGDIHERNIELLGLANKAAAKKFYYTLMMGGGGALLAADQAQFGTKMTEKEGTALRNKLIRTIPGFSELKKKLSRELAKTGRIRLCDGTPILVPSDHMVIPYLLQGDESRIMKRAMRLTHDSIRTKGLENDVFKVADIHDEWQYKVRRGVEAGFIDSALPAFRDAGESLSYLVPIEGQAKVGRTWAETH